jgi:eukaryotic-like serine/threonine-protein kinase
VLETVGRYKVQEKIGEGAMADVYRAFDPSINRALAIKVLKNEFLQDEEYAARFLREAKAAGALSHPNIVTIFDVGEVEGHPFIVMELLDGKPLDQAMAEKKSVNVEQAINIGMQLARALDYAHGQGIIHRDIKPSNIMISNDGQSVKILDYGIARLNETDALLGQEVLKTQVGAVLGTPRYMSPEQALGQTSDGRSDLYSVGIVLYELLTGKKAFSSGSMATLMLQITQQDPEPLNKIAPDVPGGLVFIVTKLLSKKPEKRFQKGMELHAALKRELAAIESQKSDKVKPRSLPLPIKVTLIATAFVGALLGISIWAALNKQNKVMEQMSITSGSAITGFVAKNIGSTMAGQDWDSVSVFVKVAAEDKNVDDILVVDNSGIIRGAKNSDLEGTRYRPTKGPILSSKNDVTVIESENKSGNRVFQFSQPVTYGNDTAGKVHVGLKQNALEAAASLSRLVLLGLGLLTLLSVMAVAYSIAAFLSRPMKRLKEAFSDASKGNFDFRISHKRKDEFGELFDGFNNMTTAVQARVETAAGFVGDSNSSPALKTALNIPAATAAGVATAVLGAEALKASPFSKPDALPDQHVQDDPETDSRETEAEAPEEISEVPAQDALVENSAPDDDADDVANDPAETELTDADVEIPEDTEAEFSPSVEIESDAPDSELAPRADIGPDTPTEKDIIQDDPPEALFADLPQVPTDLALAPEAAQPEPDVVAEIAEPEPVSEPAVVQEIVTVSEPQLAVATLAADEPAVAPADEEGFEGDSDTQNIPLEYTAALIAPETIAQQATAKPAPVVETEDFDRTVVRSPMRDSRASGLPVNPLARISDDDKKQDQKLAENMAEEDMDRTVVRPPRRPS